MIKTATYKTSSPNLGSCPPAGPPEFAFIGRSNVGKSSLINMLCNQQGLAHTSSKPGKTQLINHFLINDHWYLVDLPGYGFAKRSKSVREAWEKMIKDYLLRRTSLALTFVLIDARHEPIKGDIQFIDWLGQEQVPFALLFTKIDKVKSADIQHHLSLYKALLLESFEELPMSVLTSALTGLGREQILAIIEEFLDEENQGL